MENKQQWLHLVVGQMAHSCTSCCQHQWHGCCQTAAANGNVVQTCCRKNAMLQQENVSQQLIIALQVWLLFAHHAPFFIIFTIIIILPLF